MTVLQNAKLAAGVQEGASEPSLAGAAEPLSPVSKGIVAAGEESTKKKKKRKVGLDPRA